MKHWLIGTVAAVALLAGCGEKDKTSSTDGTSAPVEIGEISLPDVQLRSGNAAKVEDALAAFSMAQSGDGRVSFASRDLSGASATFKDVTILTGDADDDDEGGVLLAKTLTFVGLDMSAGTASFAQMTLEGVTVRSADEDEDGALTMANLQISNPSPALAAWVGSLFADEEPADFPEGAQFSFDALSMTDISVAPETDDEIEEFQIDSIDFRGMSETGLGAMMLDGLSLRATDEHDGSKAHISVGSVQVMGVGEIVAKSFMSGLDDEDVDPSELFGMLAANPGDPGYNSVRVEDFNFDVAGLQVDLPSYVADVTRDAQGRAVRSLILPFKATVSTDPEGEIGSGMAGQLGLLGYETLVIRGAGDSRIDHEADRVMADAASNYLELEDGFRVSMGGDFSGLKAFYSRLSESDLEAFDEGPFGFGTMLSELNLHGLELTFDDNSIVDRAFAAAAARDGGTPDELKSQLKQMLALAPAFAGTAGVDVDIATEFTSALGSFISNPGTLTVKLDPDTPITADMLEDPTQLTKDVLGFSARAN